MPRKKILCRAFWDRREAAVTKRKGSKCRISESCLAIVTAGSRMLSKWLNQNSEAYLLFLNGKVTLYYRQASKKIENRWPSDSRYIESRRRNAAFCCDRRGRLNLIEVYKITHNLYDSQTINHLLPLFDDDRTRGHKFKLKKFACKTRIAQNFFSNRIINVWNNLDEEVVKTESLNTFKNDIDNLFYEYMYATNFGDKIWISKIPIRCQLGKTRFIKQKLLTKIPKKWTKAKKSL